MGKPEGKVEDYLISRCEKSGFLCYKFVSPGRRGVPDRIVIGRGHVVFIELKSENGEPSEIQKLVMRRMRAAGADVRLCYTKPEVDRFMEEAESWQI